MDDQQQAEDTARVLGLHPGVRWGLAIFFGGILLFTSWRYWCFVENPNVPPSPSQLGLPTIFVFSGAMLILLLIPWERLGLRLKRIAGFEFEQVVETQATEHAEELTEIEDRLASLEKAVRDVHEGIQLEEMYYEPELQERLLDFLTRYESTAFSPMRIRQWGAKQPGFERLATYDPAFLRRTLRRLVAEGILETRISRKGNTLYRIAE